MIIFFALPFRHATQEDFLDCLYLSGVCIKYIKKIWQIKEEKFKEENFIIIGLG